MKKIRAAILSTLLFASILTNVGFATTNSEIKTANPSTAPNMILNMTPNITLWGLAGKQSIASGQGLIPFGSIGANSIFYGAVEAAGSFKTSNGYAAGAAAGFRKIINNSFNSFILGGYLFANYNRSPAGHNFWVVNPGFEALGYAWDFRVNGYIPTSSRHWIGGEKLAENIGITQFEKAFGHNRFDHLFQWYEEAGPGIDAEVGGLIPLAKSHNLKAYVGGYHYFMDKTAKITGVEGRIVYPLAKYIALEARDSYDNVRKNVFMLGIRLTFGDYNNEDKNSLGVAGRLTDPIEHNFGNFAAANSTAVGTAFIDEGIEYQLPGSFWYFDNASSSAINSNVSSGDGSYEHPFTAIDPRAYNLMIDSGPYSQNVQMYVATGSSPYDLSGMLDNRLLLPDGYSIYGRTTNFTLAATAALRPELDGGITATGNNHHISAIQLQSHNDGFATSGALFLDGAANVNINDVNINVFENSTDAYGISAVNSSATINNSVITVSSTAQGKESFGIQLKNSNVFIKNDNYIQATLISTGSHEIHAGGIAGYGTVTIFGNRNQIIADATGNESRAIGILNAGKLTISGSNNYITANAAGHDSRAGGIVDIGTTIVSGSNNNIIGNATGEDGKALGIGEIGIFDSHPAANSSGNQQITISGNYNKIIANSAESDSVGIVNFGGELTIAGNNNQIIANSTVHAAGHECNAGGIVNFDNGTVTISGTNNQINVTSPDIAYGIFWVDPSIIAPALRVKNTIFNIATTEGGTAIGINLETQTDASKIIIQSNTFNVAAAGVNSNAYGIYLPNASTPAPNGNIGANIFNITNIGAPHNAWGVYANSNWAAPAAWIRAHNIWIHPTYATPQQQVDTNFLSKTSK